VYPIVSNCRSLIQGWWSLRIALVLTGFIILGYIDCIHLVSPCIRQTSWKYLPYPTAPLKLDFFLKMSSKIIFSKFNSSRNEILIQSHKTSKHLRVNTFCSATEALLCSTRRPWKASLWNLHFMLRRKPQHTRIDGWAMVSEAEANKLRSIHYPWCRFDCSK